MNKFLEMYFENVAGKLVAISFTPQSFKSSNAALAHTQDQYLSTVVPAYFSAPYGARPSAGTVLMTKLNMFIYWVSRVITKSRYRSVTKYKITHEGSRNIATIRMLTHWGQKTHIWFIELGYHWFR